MKTYPTVDREHLYGMNTVLQQRCTQCDWQQEGMSTEYWECPFCGASERALRSQLAFGGLTISETKSNYFEFKNPHSQSSSLLCEVDTADTIAFLIKHNRYWPRAQSDQNHHIKEQPRSIPGAQPTARYSIVQLRHLVVLPLLFIISPWLRISAIAFLLISFAGIIIFAWLDAKFWHHPPLGHELPSLGELWIRVRYMSLLHKFGWSIFIICTIFMIFVHLSRENFGLLSALWFISLVFALA